MQKYVALAPLKTHNAHGSIPLLDTFNVDLYGHPIGEYLTTKIFDDNDIIKPFYKKSFFITDLLIEATANKLSEIYHIKLSGKSWKKFLFIWAYNFVQFVFYGYNYIKTAIKFRQDCIFITDQDYFPYIIDWNDFSQKMYSETLNLHILSDIVKFLCANHTVVPIQEPYKTSKVYWGNNSALKANIAFPILYYSGNIRNKPVHILDDCYGANGIDCLRQGVFRLVQQRTYGKTFALPALDFNFRKQKLVLSTDNDDFLQLVGNIALQYLPISCCECLRDILSYAKNIHINSNGALANSTSFFINPVFVALTESSHRPMAIVEHGGDQLFRYSLSKTYGIGVADRYYGYGKSAEFFLPSPYFADIRQRSSLRRPVLVGTALRPTYSPYFYSCYSLSNYAYLFARLTFLKKIRNDIYPEIRLWFTDTQNERLILDREFKGIVYQDANSISIKQVLADTCLIVLDHYSTTFHEALASGTPTIIFTPPGLYSQKAEEVLVSLRQCGIWHDTPESAADFYMQLVGKSPSWREAEKNILDWWQSAAVQKARDLFCEGYAQTSPNWAHAWQKAFDDLCR